MGTINDWDELVNIIQFAAKKTQTIEMESKDVYKFKDRHSKNFTLPKLQMKVLKVVKDLTKLQFTFHHNAKTYKTVEFLAPKFRKANFRSLFPRHSKCPKCISKEKKEEICRVLKAQLLQQKRSKHGVD